jgi:hypothetical protein
MSQPTNQGANESRGIVEVSETERHELLGVERRRSVFQVLTAEMATFGLHELAREVAAREDDADDESTVEQIAITLHHAHLPKMAELGVLSYDPERNQVEPHRGLGTL